MGTAISGSRRFLAERVLGRPGRRRGQLSFESASSTSVSAADDTTNSTLAPAAAPSCGFAETGSRLESIAFRGGKVQ